jgi:hypothetical protein
MKDLEIIMTLRCVSRDKNLFLVLKISRDKRDPDMDRVEFGG